MWHPIRLQYYCTTNSLVLLFLGMLVLLLFLEKLERIYFLRNSNIFLRNSNIQFRNNIL